MYELTLILEGGREAIMEAMEQLSSLPLDDLDLDFDTRLRSLENEEEE